MAARLSIHILQLRPAVGSCYLKRFNCTMATSQYEKIVVETRGKVRIVGINRPEYRNAVNSETAQELFRAFREFDSDESVYCAVLYGRGGTFCAGYDLKELAGVQAGSKLANNLEKNSKIGDEMAPMGPSHLLLSKPVIAAVSGYAVAGGLELSLMCDMRVAEDDAVFGVFCRRFGVPLLDGGTVRLPALIGLSRAMDMILTGRPVKAQEALEMGLANRVVKNGTSLEEAIKLADQISAFPQLCLRADRNSTYHSSFHPQSKSSQETNWLKEALNYEFSNSFGVVAKESVRGAQKFTAGVGRKGVFSKL